MNHRERAREQRPGLIRARDDARRMLEMVEETDKYPGKLKWKPGLQMFAAWLDKLIAACDLPDCDSGPDTPPLEPPTTEAPGDSRQ